jgi:hypothetical protein
MFVAFVTFSALRFPAAATYCCDETNEKNNVFVLSSYLCWSKSSLGNRTVHLVYSYVFFSPSKALRSTCVITNPGHSNMRMKARDCSAKSMVATYRS